MLSRASAWAESACPFAVGDIKYVGGRMTKVANVNCRLFLMDGEEPELVWFVTLIGTDGVEFTMSERSMPTVNNPQN